MPDRLVIRNRIGENGPMSFTPYNRPPPIEEILNLGESVLDLEYDAAGDLKGVKGTWHRLWSAMVLRHTTSLGNRRLPDDLMHEFEEKFGRELTPGEIQALDDHAKRHAETVMKGTWERRPGEPKEEQP